MHDRCFKGGLLMGQVCSCANCAYLKKTYISLGMAICHTCTKHDNGQSKYIPITQSWDRVCVHWKGAE